MKRNEIVIVVDAGCIQTIYSNLNEKVSVEILDFDNLDEADEKCAERELEQIEKNREYKEIY